MCSIPSPICGVLDYCDSDGWQESLRCLLFKSENGLKSGACNILCANTTARTSDDIVCAISAGKNKAQTKASLEFNFFDVVVVGIFQKLSGKVQKSLSILSNTQASSLEPQTPLTQLR